ncbi:signal peptidase I [Caldalkalibacillus mannanilyticus]|uniref:signal peptidase I n=1 Tax=Caldalkalibacillus mannanilyticus TaxID=1418 RepID=UPI000467FCD0|nr:signal peptidase I [Caldalkalibacillus mannanilyticus]
MQSNHQEALITLIQKTIQKNGSIDLPSSGFSMYPFIQKNDICTFVECTPSTLKQGDIVLFYCSEKKLTAHRFKEAVTIHNMPIYIFKGDTNLLPDDPVTENQLLGKLVQIKRKQKKILMTDLSSRIWSKIIFSFPILSRILKRVIKKKIRITTGASV